jgi:hypothetical protein
MTNLGFLNCKEHRPRPSFAKQNWGGACLTLLRQPAVNPPRGKLGETFLEFLMQEQTFQLPVLCTSSLGVLNLEMRHFDYSLPVFNCQFLKMEKTFILSSMRVFADLGFWFWGYRFCLYLVG